MENTEDILKRFRTVQQNQSTLSTLNEQYFFMYGCPSIGGGYTPSWTWEDGRLRMNIVQSIVDTLSSKIGKNSPRPTFLTDNGDWGNRQKAIQREKFVYGQFFKSKVYSQTNSALADCLVYGDGLVKVFADQKDVCVERVNRLELFTDDKECMYGQPRRLWQIRYMDKETAKALWPNKATELENSNAILPPFYMNGSMQDELVELIEYWKLPIKGKDGKYKGGQHSIIYGSVDVMSEEWNKPYFPFAKLQFIPNLVGWWGKGVAETVKKFQIAINFALMRMQESVNLTCVPTVINDTAAGVIKGHFNNQVGRIIDWNSKTGQPPQFVLPQGIGPDLQNFLSEQINLAYAEVGLSQLTAASVKPQGLDSGKALREYNDIETERFAAFGKRWEQFHLDVADLVLETAKEITEKHGDYAVLAPDKKGCQMINFKDIDMEKDDYVIQVYPSSSLPKTPAGRLAYVQELIAAQMIDPKMGLSLLEFPDVAKFVNLETSPMEDILATIDHMLDTDEYLPPETYQDLTFGIAKMNSAYLYYKNQKCPEEKLDLLIRWINDAIALMQPPQDPVMTSSDIIPGEAPIEMEQPIDPNVAPIDPMAQGVIV